MSGGRENVGKKEIAVDLVDKNGPASSWVKIVFHIFLVSLQEGYHFPRRWHLDLPTHFYLKAICLG